MPSEKHDVAALRLSPSYELKLDGTATPSGTISGIASAFGPPADSYGDLIGTTAFDRTLSEHRASSSMPACLWSHDPSRPIGRWTAMRTDARGLHVQGRLNLKTEAGLDAFEHLKASDVSGLSIGYRVGPGGRVPNDDGSNTLVDVDLLEASVVALPSNARARVLSVKTLQTKSELVELLHGGGLSRAAAQKVALGGWKGLAGSDDDQPACLFCGAEKSDDTVLIQGVSACICVNCVREAKQLGSDNNEDVIAALRASIARWKGN